MMSGFQFLLYPSLLMEHEQGAHLSETLFPQKQKEKSLDSIN